MNNVEEWRKIPGFPSYSASTTGRIRRDTITRGKVGGILVQTPRKRGYVKVALCENGVPVTIDVHRLIALTFLGPAPSPQHEVAHGDGVRDHNYLDNLSWKTPEQNNQDKYSHGTVPLGESHHMTNLDTECVIAIRQEYQLGASQHGLARKFGCCAQTINNIVHRRVWKHVT